MLMSAFLKQQQQQPEPAAVACGGRIDGALLRGWIAQVERALMVEVLAVTAVGPMVLLGVRRHGDGGLRIFRGYWGEEELNEEWLGEPGDTAGMMRELAVLAGVAWKQTMKGGAA